MDEWLFGFALFAPVSLAPNLALVYLIGRWGRALVQAKPSRKEPVLLAHHLACAASAAFCSAALPVLFFVFFPIYVENIDPATIAMRLFVANLALGLVLQVRGHRAILAAGERYDEALQPGRRPVLLSRFRLGVGAAAFFVAGAGAGAIVMGWIDSTRVDNFREAHQRCTQERAQREASERERRASLAEALEQERARCAEARPAQGASR